MISICCDKKGKMLLQEVTSLDQAYNLNSFFSENSNHYSERLGCMDKEIWLMFDEKKKRGEKQPENSSKGGRSANRH
jgi:hypothetical protein